MLLITSWRIMKTVLFRKTKWICPPFLNLLGISKHYPFPNIQLEDEDEQKCVMILAGMKNKETI